MTDVEKYGLFAVVFVGGLFLLIAFQSQEEPAAAGSGQAAAAVARPAPKAPTALRPVVIDPRTRRSASTRAAPAAGAKPLATRPASAKGASLDPAAGVATNTQPAANARADETVVFRVRDPVPHDTPFQWEEEPFPYPGEHSVAGRPMSAAPRQRVTHVVEEGETLSDISQTYFGTSQRWRDIVTLNPNVDPKRLRVGQVLVIRGAPAPVAAETESPQEKKTKPATYTVQAGDTLGHIAQKLLGSVDRVDDLYEANRDALASPDSLKVGQVLRVP